MAKTSTLKILLSALLFMQGLTTSAYTDHRHTKVDSAEQVLKSGKPLTERERMDCYHTLIRGYLGKDSEKHIDRIKSIMKECDVTNYEIVQQ